MKSPIAKTLIAMAGALCFINPAEGRDIVQVDIYGTVVFNGTVGPPLATVTVGQTARTSFTVDSTIFVDSIPGDVRAYDINPASFSLSFSGGASVGLLPGPAFFGIRDGDPVADGFFVSDSPISIGGVALSQPPYREDFHNSYVGGTLSSVDILSAVGTYDFTGLTVYGYTLWQAFPDNVRMEIEFSHMTIAVVPGPASLLVFAPLILGMHRRRRC
jgi:hypothetical protein